MTEEPLPDRRQHGYVELEEKIDTYHKHFDERLSRFIRKALFAFAIIGVASAVSVSGFGLVLTDAAHVSDEIQKQRYKTIVKNCLDQNDRHDQTILQAQTMDKESKLTVIVLVNKLQPYTKDCNAFARARVKEV